MKTEASFILTVDTGGTKTKMTLFDLGGNAHASVKCDGMGFFDDLPGGFPFLKDAARELLCGKDPSSVLTVCANVGGKNTKQIENALRYLFPCAQVEAFRESSGVIMSALCDAEGADAILMAGTGTIALAKGKGGAVINDGWSPNLGDFGSGYWIGLQAVSRSLKELEGVGELSELCRRVTGLDKPFSLFADTSEQMNIRDGVRARFVPIERSRIASLCRVAAECARGGDATALGIFKDAGRELAETVIRGLRIAKLNEAEIFVSGGLINCFELWKESFEKALKDSGGAYSYHTGEADMTRGAIAYAMKKTIG